MSEAHDNTDASGLAAGREFLIATDLLLLLLDDDEDRAAVGVRDKIDPALAGAVLAELSLAGVADVTDSDRTFRSTHVTVDNAETVTDPVLQNAVAIIGETPDPRTGVLVALLNELGQAHKIITRDGVSAETVKNRAADIAEGSWATDAVKKAIQAAQVPGALAGAGIT